MLKLRDCKQFNLVGMGRGLDSVEYFRETVESRGSFDLGGPLEVELRTRLIFGVVKLRTTFGVVKLRTRPTFGVDVIVVLAVVDELRVSMASASLLKLTSVVDGIRGSLRLGAEPMVQLR